MVISFAKSSIRVIGAAFFLVTVGAWAQSFGGRVVGNVTDPAGGAVDKVAVTILNEGTGAERQLSTDVRGLYVGSELPVGYYTVRFQHPGFSQAERLHVKVDVGGETRADAALSLQTVEQSI